MYTSRIIKLGQFIIVPALLIIFHIDIRFGMCIKLYVMLFQIIVVVFFLFHFTPSSFYILFITKVFKSSKSLSLFDELETKARKKDNSDANTILKYTLLQYLHICLINVLNLKLSTNITMKNKVIYIYVILLQNLILVRK